MKCITKPREFTTTDYYGYGSVINKPGYEPMLAVFEEEDSTVTMIISLTTGNESPACIQIDCNIDNEYDGSFTNIFYNWTRATDAFYDFAEELKEVDYKDLSKWLLENCFTPVD